MPNLTLVALSLVLLALPGGRAPEGRPVLVRYPGGVMHGFLVLRDLTGAAVAYGDAMQTMRGATVVSQTLLKFVDGSLHHEASVFTQDSIFALRHYQLVQRGPAFPTETDVTLDGTTGTYRVWTRSRTDGTEQTYEGTVDLPADTYNGMVSTIIANLEGAHRSVHLIAFVPKPQLIGLDLAPAGRDSIAVGDEVRTALHYVVEPQLGVFREVVTKVLGKAPADYHVWIITDGAPGFVRFEGPLYLGGPVRRIELAVPEWPH